MLKELLLCALTGFGALRYPVSQTFVSYQSQTFVDQYSASVNYSGTDNSQGYYDIIINLTYDGTDWSYNNHLYDDGSIARLFCVSNGLNMPSIVEGDVDEYGTYGIPSSNNAFFGLISRNTSNGDMTRLLLRSTGNKTNLATGMDGRDYFVNMRIFMTINGYLFNQSTNNYDYVMGNSYTILRPSWNESSTVDRINYSYDISFSNNYYNTQCDFIQVHLSAFKTTDDDLTSAYNNGYDTGYNNGYQNGYNDGLEHTNFSFTQLFGAIADTPILMLRSLFDFDLFGINLLLAIMSLLTGLIIFALVRKFIH